MSRLKQVELRLESQETISPSTRLFRFADPQGGRFEYSPGQFYRCSFEDADGAFERSYSVANFTGEPGNSDALEFIISRVESGRASKLLFDQDDDNVINGLRCSATGPFGNLILPDPLPVRLVLVATSVGLAPYLPMLGSLRNRQAQMMDGCSVELVFGVRSGEEFIYQHPLMELAAETAWFTVTVCLSRADPGSVDFPAIRGYVQDRLEQMGLDPDADHVMLCGNPNMVDGAYAALQSKGFGVHNAVREKYVYAREVEAVDKPVPTADQKKLIAEKLAKLKR